MTIDFPQQGLTVNPVAAGVYVTEFDLLIPSQIKMIFSGKNQDLDTILDHNNCIVQDLYVKLNRISLDNIPVEVHVSKIANFLSCSGLNLSTDYIGFNGELSINIDQDNTFDQIMTWNRLNF